MKTVEVYSKYNGAAYGLKFSGSDDLAIVTHKQWKTQKGAIRWAEQNGYTVVIKIA